MTMLRRVLQDTRSDKDRNNCSLCWRPLQLLAFHSTSAYNIYVFRCPTCGNIATLLEENYEDDTQ